MRRPSFYSKFFTNSVIMMVLKHPKRTNVVSSEMRCLGSYSGLNTLTKKRCLLLLLVIKTQGFGVVLLDVCETFLYTHDLHSIKQTELENNSFLLAFTVISCSLCFFLFFLQLFRGNFDRHTVVAYRFVPPFKAQFVRIHPRSWRSRISMRVEFYGCLAGT